MRSSFLYLVFWVFSSLSSAADYLNFDPQTYQFQRDESVYTLPDSDLSSINGCCERLAESFPEQFLSRVVAELSVDKDKEYLYSFQQCDLQYCNLIQSTFVNQLDEKLGLKLVDAQVFMEKVIVEMDLCDVMTHCSAHEQLSQFEFDESPNLIFISAYLAKEPIAGLELAVAIGNREQGFSVYDIFERGRLSRRVSVKAAQRLVSKIVSASVVNETIN